MKAPSKRYAKDVMGMPAFAAVTPIAVIIAPEHIADAVPQDDENCAVALGCRRQLGTPYVSVGRRRTDLALPHPKGVVKAGFGPTKWAVIRHENAPSCRRVIIKTDLEQWSDGESGIVVELVPPRSSDLPGRFRSGAANGKGRKLNGTGQDRLTFLGVRNLNGQRKRKAAKR